MKRINIHFDESNIKRLDEIASDVRKKIFRYQYCGNTTRADLIRFAVVNFYDLPTTFTHVYGKRLLEGLEKLKVLQVKVK